MGYSMKNKGYLGMLLKNYRLMEATGYIASMVNTGNLSLDRGEACECLVRSYKKVICDSLWNSEGLFILTLDKKIDNFNDLVDERKRLVGLIEDFMENDKKLLFPLISAYYALANEDRLHFKVHMNELWKELEASGKKVANATLWGGYEEFQFLADELGRIFGWDTSAFSIINQFSIDIRP